MTQLHFCRLRREVRFLIGLVLVFVLVQGQPATAQTPTRISPTPLESGIVPTYPAPTGIAPPMSIGPAPTFAPQSVQYPPVTGFDGRPVFIGPPVYPAYSGPQYGVPYPGGQPLPPPPQPVPIAAGYAPTQGMFPAAAPQRAPGRANFRVAVSENFLNRLVAQERVDPGPVRDFVLGAQVTGRQTTVSRLRVDLIASDDKARTDLILNGDVQSLTTGVTPQAMIDTAGQQRFVAVKEVYFDGNQFSTRHATVFIRAQNQTIGAVTPLSGTLFGGLANRIAYRAAERQKAAGEAVARDRLAERLFPTFDGEVDAKLAQANRQLEPVRKRLDAVKLLPSLQSSWTSDSHLYYESFIGDDKSSAPLPAANDMAERDNGLRFSIHESLINTIIDRTGLKGLKTTDRKLRELEKSLLTLTGNGRGDDAGDPESTEKAPLTAPDLPAGTEGFETDIEFDEIAPLTVRIEKDRLFVILKAHFKPAGQAVMPPMTVTIPYHTELTTTKMRLVAGKPRVVSQERTDPNAPQTIVEMAVEKVIESDLIPLEFNRSLPAAMWPANGTAIPRITSISSDNGWLHISIE